MCWSGKTTAISENMMVNKRFEYVYICSSDERRGNNRYVKGRNANKYWRFTKPILKKVKTQILKLRKKICRV